MILVSGSFRGVLEAAQRFDAVSAVKIPFGSLNFLFPAVGVAFGLNLLGIVTLLVLGWVGAFAAFVTLNFRFTPELRNIKIEPSVIRSLFSFGGWVMLSSIAASVLSYLERFVIAGVLTVGVLAYYVVPYEMVSRIVILPASFAVTLFPAFSYYGPENRSMVQQLVSRPVKYLMLVLGPLIVLVIFFGEKLLAVWMGVEFARQGTIVLQILAITFFFHAFAHIPFSAVHGFGRPDLKAKFDLILVPLFAGICMWLIPLFGIVGAAVAKCIVTIIDLLFLSWMLKRLSGISITELIGQRTKRAALVVAFFAFVAALLAISSSSLVVDAIGLALLAVLYLLLSLHYVLDASDRELFRHVGQYLRFRAKRT